MKREEVPDEMIIHKNDEAINDTEKFGVNKTQKQILKFIAENPQITAGEMAYKMKQTKRNVEYNIKALKSKGIIERFGPDKTGGYRIKQ
ncbi:MAG: winged helix-turn-helix domain-containing protein [Tannerellaceae bacterium]|nr:winged helix-turn-helix domain-containing protein [Tannerellaceae bacterium]